MMVKQNRHHTCEEARREKLELIWHLWDLYHEWTSEFCLTAMHDMPIEKELLERVIPKLIAEKDHLGVALCSYMLELPDEMIARLDDVMSFYYTDDHPFQNPAGMNEASDPTVQEGRCTTGLFLR